MRRNYKYIRSYLAITGIAISLLLSSCEKFTELGAPPTQVEDATVFTSDVTATSAVMGLYSGGATSSLIIPYTMYPGMSADDIQYNTVNADYDAFETNTLSINNNVNTNIL